MKVTRAEVMRQALDEYWESHKSELQAADGRLRGAHQETHEVG